MKIKVCLFALAALACVALLGLSGAEPPKRPAAATRPGPAVLDISGMKITGPHTHDNLTVFFIHSPDRIKGKEFLTLQEALKAKKIVIHETGDVNELSVENKGDVPIYVQSGDIIKGGKQDRMLPYDYVIAPRSGRKPISSFCVESGRWSRRGTEAVGLFGGNSNVAGSRVLLAGKLSNSQRAVWREVANNQAKLSSNVGVTVSDSRSASSLQLALENPKLKEAARPYKAKLAKLLEGNKDTVGYAVAINGQVTDVHVYASRALLTKLWPKLLETSTFEAIAELNRKPKKTTSLTVKDVRKFVAEIEAARARDRKIAQDMMLQIKETKGGASFRSMGADGEIHRSYTKKPQPDEKKKPD